ncbi:hypothetical protein CY35_16G082400 [Sphagnum magellanicum]|nr:hypothetical protein CY35_16G082400 [Sphagnum magellanicum]
MVEMDMQGVTWVPRLLVVIDDIGQNEGIHRWDGSNDIRQNEGIHRWDGELHEWLPRWLRKLDEGRPHSVRELDEGIPHWVRELWKFSPIELEEWMQHAEKPRRMRSFKELTNLITKFLPSKIEELLQLEKERERLMCLKEELVSLKDKKRMREKTLEWSSDMRQVEFVEEQIKLAEKRMYLESISDRHQVEFVENQIKLAEEWTYFDKGDGAASDIVYPILEKMIFEHNHNALTVLEKFHSRYPRDLKISQLLDKIKRISGFPLGVVVLFIYQYLMGYVEIGRWNTYSSGAWEFRATYVCIELRLGSYPFQKFRETPRKYSGVTKRTYDTKNGIIYKYEPWVRFKKDKFYFEGQTTAKKAARIRDVAKFWLKIKGRKGYNFGEEEYNYLNFVQEFHPQQSDDEIKRLVLEHAQPILKEDQQSQVPDVEPARFASGEDRIIQELSAFMEMIEEIPSDDTNEQTADMIEEIPSDDTNEQTADMIEELQSVSPDLDIAGPTIEDNIREHWEALISSAGPSLIESGCTSQITLIAPCNGTGAGVDLFTELKVFRKENWGVKTGEGAKLSCALEGCSATMHKFAFLQKSGF